MSSRKDSDPSRNEGEGDDEPVDAEPGGTYTYTCPICGVRKTGFVRGEPPTERALSALESHVRQRDGADHGPRYELPEGVTRESLKAWIEITK